MLYTHKYLSEIMKNLETNPQKSHFFFVLFWVINCRLSFLHKGDPVLKYRRKNYSQFMLLFLTKCGFRRDIKKSLKTNNFGKPQKEIFFTTSRL